MQVPYSPGSIAFTPPQDWVGRLICRATSSPYSHCKVVLTADGHCVHAIPPVVHVTVVLTADVVVPVRYATPEDARLATQYALSALDERYSYWSFASDILGMCKIPLFFGLRGTLNCAELAFRALEAGGVRLGFDAYDGISPGELYRLLTDKKGTS